MRIIELDELRQMANDSRQQVWDIAKSLGREPKVYLHWSAGGYQSIDDDYSICITYDPRSGTAKLVDMTDGDLVTARAHTYHRNSASVGISICSAAGATTNNLGGCPPTPAQIELMAQAIEAICDGWWLTINSTYVMTHGEAANNDDGWNTHEPYAVWSIPQPDDGNTRWDLEWINYAENSEYNPEATDGSRGGDVIRGKANYYRDKLRPVQHDPSDTAA